jgi:hypothetical protein
VGCLESGHGAVAGDRREGVEELIDAVAALEIVDEVAARNPFARLRLR